MLSSRLLPPDILSALGRAGHGARVLIAAGELSLFGSCASAGEYQAASDLMACGAITATPLLSAVAPLRDGASWFDPLYRKEPGLLKVVLKP
jgi:threonine dehydrogenase-like Zn-dependent dehydrogenase